MASLRTRFQSAANDASFGYAPYSSPAWQNPAGALADGGDPAKVDPLDTEVTTNLLVLTNLVDKIPSGATPTGFEIHAKTQTDESDSFPMSQAEWSLVRVVSGTTLGDDRSVSQERPVYGGAAASIKNFGEVSDKFGLSPSASDVNSSGFGVHLALRGGAVHTNGGVKIHDCEITIHYTE